VLLKICHDDFLFYITHTKLLDILGFFIIIFCIALAIVVENGAFFKRKKFLKIKKILILILTVLLLNFVSFVFIWSLSASSYEGCSCNYIGSFKYDGFKITNEVNNMIVKNKIIVVGDSRMQFLNDDKGVIKPDNVTFVALSGSGYDWLENEAMTAVNKILKNRDLNVNYSIVFNMGVNDINVISDEEEVARDYFKLYRKFAWRYPNIKIYLMSVNPVNNKIINKYWPGNTRTNKRIENFNKEIVYKIQNTTANNIYYCDSYHKIKFNTSDGLHYDRNTNKKIIKYIINDCVKY
jgi:hypothetical protein